jgi:hypothetical protein
MLPECCAPSAFHVIDPVVDPPPSTVLPPPPPVHAAIANANQAVFIIAGRSAMPVPPPTSRLCSATLFHRR